MKNFCYEFRNTLKNRYGLIISIMLVLTFVAYSVHVGEEYSANQPVSLETYGYGIKQNGNLTGSIQVLNQYGVPVAGSFVDVKNTHSLNLSGITNRAGFYNFTIVGSSTLLNESLCSGTGDYYEVTYLGQKVHGILKVYSPPINSYFYEKLGNNCTGATMNKTREQLIPRYKLIPVYLRDNVNRIGLEILHFSLGGNTTQPVFFYYHKGKYTVRDSLEENNSIALNTSNEKFIEKVSVNTISILPLTNLSISNGTYFYFSLYTRSGKLLSQLNITLSNAIPSRNLTQFFIAEIEDNVNLFLPFMALALSFISFGRDKTGGTMDSVLTLPITRRTLILSRYSASLVLLTISTITGLIFSDLIYYHYFGALLNLTTLLYCEWALFVIISSNLGLGYLLGRILNSETILFGSLFLIFIVLDLFWSSTRFSLIPEFVFYLLGIVPQSDALYHVYVIMYLINPTSYDILTQFILGTGNSAMSVYAYSLFSEMTFIHIYFVVGGLWVIVPILLMFGISKKRL